MTLIFETKNFILESHERPEIDRLEGGHVKITPKVKVEDRTKLSPELANELMQFTIIAGKAMVAGMARRGVKIGRINYQDNGNWTPHLHIHLYCRAVDAKVQKYGDPIRPGHRKDLMSLNEADIEAIRKELKKLIKSGKNKQYFYPLYKQVDKDIYKILADSVAKENFPVLSGSDEQVNELLKLIIYSGKAKDYREFRDAFMTEFKTGKVTVARLLKIGEGLDIPEGVITSWAIFTQDKEICELLDDFKAKEIKFKGNMEETNEFIKRFMLSQLLQDWRGPKLAVVVEALEQGEIKLSELNVILAKWDFTGMFD